MATFLSHCQFFHIIDLLPGCLRQVYKELLQRFVRAWVDAGVQMLAEYTIPTCLEM
jgi:hypothetical protein